MSFWIFIKNFSQVFFDAVLPHRCLACGEIVSSGGFVCQNCFDKINFISSACCQICGTPFDYTEDANLTCPRCLQHKPEFDAAKAVFLYDGVGRDLIRAFKYSDRTEACNYFAKLMVNAGRKFFAEEEFKPDYIVPVPIHYKRLLARKYNQSALLARAIALNTGQKVCYDALIRTRNTKPQANFFQKERFKNVKGVFNVNKLEIVKDKKILLIDDVLTTGATVSECAKAMKEQGASKVYVLALARTKI
ncbi:MAG: double zinc ribbon domain-containing protein [Alphaproteobacteria bacterium]